MTTTSTATQAASLAFSGARGSKIGSAFWSAELCEQQIVKLISAASFFTKGKTTKEDMPGFLPEN